MGLHAGHEPLWYSEADVACMSETHLTIEDGNAHTAAFGDALLLIVSRREYDSQCSFNSAATSLGQNIGLLGDLDVRVDLHDYKIL